MNSGLLMTAQAGKQGPAIIVRSIKLMSLLILEGTRLGLDTRDQLVQNVMDGAGWLMSRSIMLTKHAHSAMVME